MAYWTVVREKTVEPDQRFDTTRAIALDLEHEGEHARITVEYEHGVRVPRARVAASDYLDNPRPPRRLIVSDMGARIGEPEPCQQH
jgi:hypothetical protein